MRNFFDDVIFPVLLIVGVLVAFFSIVIGIASGIEAYQCAKYEAVTERPTRFSGLSCYVQHQGSWYSMAEYKHRLVAKGEFSK